MSKIIDLEVLGNFKERQDAVNEDKFLKRSNVTANGNEVKIVTTEADSDQGISEVSYTALTPNSSLNASKITGVIDISHIPASAQERVVTVANATARKALTTNDVQKGDVVKETDTGLMYFVVDDTKLNQDAGYTAFAAGIASSADTVKLTPTRADSNYALVYADATTITSATTKGLAVASHSSTAANCPIRVNPGVNNSTSQGYATLLLGNNINNGTAYNKQGRIILYGTNTGYTTIVPGYASTSNITLTLPSATGTIALTSSNITGSSASCTGNAATATTASACSGNSATATTATNAVNVKRVENVGTWLAILGVPSDTANNANAATTTLTSGNATICDETADSTEQRYTVLALGNTTAVGTSGNRAGALRLQGANNRYIQFQNGTTNTSNRTITLNSNLTANRTYTLPNTDGTIALTSSDITGNAATATTASACSGNAATATTATNANKLNTTIATSNWYSLIGVPYTDASGTNSSVYRCSTKMDVGWYNDPNSANTSNSLNAATVLRVGNETANAANGEGRRGILRVHSNTARRVDIVAPDSLSANRTVTLPSSDGTIALTSSDITGNAASATTVKLTHAISTDTEYPLVFGSTITGDDSNQSLHVSMSTASSATSDYCPLRCKAYGAAANTQGESYIVIGNVRKTSQSPNSRGSLRLYGTSSGYTQLLPGNNTTSNVTVTLPSSTGTIALTSDISASNVISTKTTDTTTFRCDELKFASGFMLKFIYPKNATVSLGRTAAETITFSSGHTFTMASAVQFVDGTSHMEVQYGTLNTTKHFGSFNCATEGSWSSVGIGGKLSTTSFTIKPADYIPSLVIIAGF